MTTTARARRARGRKRRVTALACACALAAWTARTTGAEANASSDVERLMGRLREARRLGPRDGRGANEGEDVDVDGARARARRRGAEAAVEGGATETRDESEFVDADADAGKTNRGEEKDEDEEDEDEDDEDEDDEDDEEPSFRSEDAPDGHVIGTYDTCDTCESCALGDPPPGVAVNARARSKGNATRGTHCKTCYGCNVVVSRISKKTEFRNKTVAVQGGASGAAVFKAKMLDETRSEDAKTSEDKAVKDVFVKVWCGLKGGYRHVLDAKNPIPEKCGDAGFEHPGFTGDSPCREKGVDSRFACNVAHLGAIDRMAEEAGVAEVIPRMTTLRAKTFLPWDDTETAGFKQDVDVLVFDAVPGVSLESLGASTSRDNFDLMAKINPDRMYRIALFEMLTSQADRHAQNVFITEGGDVHVIDNESSMLGELNSMLIPGGQKHETYRTGFATVNCQSDETCDAPRVTPPSFGALTDYRCYVEGGYIGTNYPKQFTEFLEKIVAMKDAEEVYEYFQLAVSVFAEKLKERAHDMLTLGFEGTAKKMYAAMPKGDGRFGTFQYDIHPPCCGPGECRMSGPNNFEECLGGCDRTVDPRAKVLLGANTPERAHSWLDDVARAENNATNDSTDATASTTPSAITTPSTPPPTRTQSDDTALSTEAPNRARASALRERVAALAAALAKLRAVDDTLTHDPDPSS